MLSTYGSVSRGCGETDADGYLENVVERVTIVKEGDKIISKEPAGDRVLSPETPTVYELLGLSSRRI
ncbi:MAG: hypothetical protein WDO15_15630 [Bacteroidota bacterium]